MAALPDGTVSFLEIGAGDAAATLRFFAAVFGWPMHDGKWLQTPTVRAGVHGDETEPQIYVFFAVADLDAAMARVRDQGGQAGALNDVPGFGRFSHCRAPGGTQFGLHEAISG